MMKATKLIRNALANDHLYNDDELKRLRNKLAEFQYEKQYDQWYRRSRQGFSNEPAPEAPITDALTDSVHGMDDGTGEIQSEGKPERHQL